MDGERHTGMTNRARQTRVFRRIEHAWSALPKWKKGLSVLLVAVVLGALVDGLNKGPTLAEDDSPPRRDVAEFCQWEAAASLGLGPLSVEHSTDAATHVKSLGAGQYRVIHTIRLGPDHEPIRFLCLALETRPGSGTFLLADLNRL